MPDPYEDLNEVMAKLDGLAVRTSQGTYVKTEDVRKLLEERREAAVRTEPAPRTFDQARAAATRYLAEQGMGNQGPGDVGRSIPAAVQEPQPSSRT